MINSLMTLFSLPPFSNIKTEDILPAVKEALKQCYSNVKKIVDNTGPFTWNNLCLPLDETNDYLSKIWSPIEHLNAVKNSKKLREVYEKSLPLLSEYNTWIGQHKGLYKAYCKLRNSDYYAELNLAQKKSIDNKLRYFELSGIKLSAKKQQRYGQIVSRLSELDAKYSNNVLDSTTGWSKLVTEKKILNGMPEDAISSAFIQAQNKQKNGWLLTLDITSYLPVITYCDNEQIRKELYQAYNTRSSDQGPNAGKWDNGPIINEILSLRHELAQLLKFENFAYKSLVDKMVKDPMQVLKFLTDLTKIVQPQGKKEAKRLFDFAKKYFNRNTLFPWDIAYYSEKQKQYLLSISDEELRPYFPEEQVIKGLFTIVNNIYNIKIKQRYNVEVWHSDVRFFDILYENNELIGSFYMDLYVRNNKRNGAWMSECVNMMRRKNGKLQRPVAYITCNFNSPINKKPALFTHNEVITLFHEFGHVLHHTLTCIDTREVSGINGVPWDAVELPSQFMENYCWQPEALKLISNHYKTKDPLPEEKLKKLIESKNYHSSLFILRQLEFCLFDLLVHYHYQTNKNEQIINTTIKVKRQVSVLPSAIWERFPHTFSHIFAGSYAVGYYSYLWANVLAADVWSRFEEEGIFNNYTGKSFLNTILSQGGSEDPMILFMNFRGRKPQLNAMLHSYGIKKQENK